MNNLSLHLSIYDNSFDFGNLILPLLFEYGNGSYGLLEVKKCFFLDAFLNSD